MVWGLGYMVRYSGRGGRVLSLGLRKFALEALRYTADSAMFRNEGVEKRGRHSASHYQSTLDAVYVYVVPWSEFPIVSSYPHYPQLAPVAGHVAFGGQGCRV